MFISQIHVYKLRKVKRLRPVAVAESLNSTESPTRSDWSESCRHFRIIGLYMFLRGSFSRNLLVNFPLVTTHTAFSRICIWLLSDLYIGPVLGLYY
jgi:hypothetical protein